MTDEEIIRQTGYFIELAKIHGDVDVWADDGYVDGSGTSYYAIVLDVGERVRVLSVVRVKDGIVERRDYDDRQREVWRQVS